MKPKKPWRVKLTGHDVTGVSQFTSEKKTYEFVCAAFAEAPGDVPMVISARIEQWADGRWCHFETLTQVDFPQVKDAEQ